MRTSRLTQARQILTLLCHHRLTNYLSWPDALQMLSYSVLPALKRWAFTKADPPQTKVRSV